MSSMSLRRPGLPALLAVAALIGCASVARAQEVLARSINPNGNVLIPNELRPLSLAFAFTLSDGPWILSDIVIPLGAAAPNSQINTISASLWSDVGGMPTLEITPLTLTNGGIQSYPPSPLTYTPTGTVTLTGGTTYWIVARLGAPGSLSYSVGGSNTGTHGTILNLFGLRDEDGPWAVYNTPQLPILTVRGTQPVSGNNGGGGNGGVVPEPSEWAAMGVLGLALGGLVVRKRRTR